MAGFNNYRHELWIGIGEKSHFYTLRETHPIYTGSNVVLNGVFQGNIELGHHHVQNLSQDPVEAVAKAREIAAKRGIPLEKVTPEDLEGRLAEIRRATAEELAERERIEKANQEYWAEMRAATEAMHRDMVECGVCPIGRYAGKDIADIDRGYATWLIDKRGEFEEGSLMRALADKVATDYAHLRLPEPDPAAQVGAIGERREFEATVIRVNGFYTDFGYTGLITMVTDDGVCLLAKGGWRVRYDKSEDRHVVAAMPGERIKFKGTVKQHKPYNGQMQTVVNRVKESA